MDHFKAHSTRVCFEMDLWDRNLIEKYRADNAASTERNRPILPP
jgi:hypothetical protein